MQSYQAARTTFNLLGFVSWLVIIFGLIVSFGGATAVSSSSFGRNLGAMDAILAAMPGVGIALSGLIGLALVQMGRAGVDSAEYSQQSLEISRKQLELAQQAALLPGTGLAASYASQIPEPNVEPTPVTEPPTSESTYQTDKPEPQDEARSDAVQDGELLQDTEVEMPALMVEPPASQLPDVSEHVSYKDGKYFVGGKRFWSRPDAEHYAREQLLEPAETSSA